MKSLIEVLRGAFKSSDETVKKIPTKKEALPTFIEPINQEIPPDRKSGLYLEAVKSWVYVAISAIADEVSSTPLRLYEEVDGKWVERENHPAVSLFDKPNSFQTREAFFWQISAYLLAEGEAPLLLNKPINPTEIVILNPTKISPIFDRDNIIGKYKYIKSDGKTEIIDANLIVFMTLPNLQTPFRGQGVLSFIPETIDLDKYLENYIRVFFFNSAMPTGVLETDQPLNAEHAKRIRTQFENRHKGEQKFHKISVLDKGLKFNATSFKISDLQVGTLANDVRDKILSAFKVPKSVVGVIDDVNRANGENADRVFARRAVKPKLKLIEAQFNVFLLPKFTSARRLWLEFDNPVQEDVMLQAQIDQIYLNMGVISPDEVRERMGLDPMQIAEKEPEEDEEDEDDEAEEEEEKGIVGVCKEMLKDEQHETEITKEAVEKYHEEKIRFTMTEEEILRRKFVIHYEQLLQQNLNQLHQKNWEDVDIDEDEETTRYVKILAPSMGATIEQQSKLTYSLIGSSGVIQRTDKIAKEFIKKYSYKVGKTTSKTIRDGVAVIITKWNKMDDEKRNVATLEAMLTKYYRGLEVDHSKTIARTEVSRSAGFATKETYKRTGYTGKKWVTSPYDVCAFCAEMDGTIVDVDEDFFAKGDSLVTADGQSMKFDFGAIEQYPLHPNCVSGDTFIHSPDAKRIQRMKYSGELVKLSFSDGTSLTVTPNHQILTKRGFIFARSLKNTDNVVTQCVPLSNPDDDASPSSISEIFDALTESGSVTVGSVPVSPEDFHGDGQFGNGNVDIIFSDGFLRNAVKEIGKNIESTFFNPRLATDTFVGESDFASMLLALSFASDGDVSVASVKDILLGSPIAHHNAVSFLHASGYDSRLKKSFSDSPAVNIEAFSDVLLALQGNIRLKNVINVDKFSVHNEYVYDLSTTSTIYSANGIITSNCRCDIIPVDLETEKANGEYRRDVRAGRERVAKTRETLEAKAKELAEREAKLEANIKAVEDLTEKI